MKKEIELLAPAGSIETFQVALEAGADAIYLGFGDFNARQRSKNFRAETLAFLIPQAQAMGKKVYVALNTLIKDGEMPQFIDMCNILKQLKPDAVIVQDLGMAAMLRKNFPKIELHGSTQMAIHNSAGFEAAEKLGITRVVPARELTLQEIRKINNKTNLEIELFVHGALCYSVSGNCLASSFLGGSSGNRGKCTQVCRRKFKEGKKEGFYFSPKDFWAIDYVDEYRNIGITSLKIEGRMRSSEYVYGVTSTYREYIDGGISLDEAKERLSKDFGREKCSFLLGGDKSTGIVSAGKPAGTGIFAGKVEAFAEGDILIDDKGSLVKVGDRVRFQSIRGGEGEVSKVEAVKTEIGMVRVTLSDTNGIEIDGSLFIISRVNRDLRAIEKRKADVRPVKIIPKKGVPAGKIMSVLDNSPKESKNANLFVRVDSIEWLKMVRNQKNARFILSLSEEEATEFSINKHGGGKIGHSLIIALPTLIPETKVAFWKEVIDRLRKEGITNWMVSQYGEKELFKESDTLYADYPVWSINRYTQKMLIDNGFKMFSYSPEDDIMNLKRTGSPKGLFPTFMRVPLFLSRVQGLVRDGKEVKDDRQEAFIAQNRDGLSCLISTQPIGLTHRVGKLMGYGISNFVVDFSWYEPDRAFFREIMENWKSQTRVEGSSLFNHKGGLK